MRGEKLPGPVERHLQFGALTGGKYGSALVICSIITGLAIVVSGTVVLNRAGPILKRRIIDSLSARFNGRVELGSLEVSVLHGLQVTGADLRIYPSDSAVAVIAGQPLIKVGHFSFHSGLIGLFFEPLHVRSMKVTQALIDIPPREAGSAIPSEVKKVKSKNRIVVDEIICENSLLIIGTPKADKDPKTFELQNVELREVGPNAPLTYKATLTNPVPRGEIHASGTFGPWQTQTPGDTLVTGHYTFNHVDMSTINGLGGVLSSTGSFRGQLDRIVIDGRTESPDFSLDTVSHGMPVKTVFHAVVDGTSGDTYLQLVKARLGGSDFTTSGTVHSVKGQGHMITLDVDMPDCRIQDFLHLAVKTEPALLTGRIRMRAKLRIRPGSESITRKLRMDGRFSLRSIHFTNPRVQDKVDMLSLRAQGKPKAAWPGGRDVNSLMEGRFFMADRLIRLTNLDYVLPGARVELQGSYSLDDQRFNLHGTVRTKATLSHLVSSRWAALLLKPVSPFFRRNGAGAEIPVTVSGTRSEPKFGLDLFRKRSDHDSPTRNLEP